MMEVVVTTGPISRAQLQSDHHHQQTNIQFFLQAGCPSCRPANTVKALTEKKITFHGPAYPKLTWGSSNFVSDH